MRGPSRCCTAFILPLNASTSLPRFPVELFEQYSFQVFIRQIDLGFQLIRLSPFEDDIHQDGLETSRHRCRMENGDGYRTWRPGCLYSEFSLKVTSISSSLSV